MKPIFFIINIFFICLIISCSSTDNPLNNTSDETISPTSPTLDPDPVSDPDPMLSSPTDFDSSPSESENTSSTDGESPSQIPPGQLTAGVFNDRDDWDFWLSLDSVRNPLEDWNLTQWTTSAQPPELSVTTSSSTLDLLFIVDATGSMGDEILYLKAELQDVITKVAHLDGAEEIRLALLFYRDVGDEYVTRSFDFSQNIDSQIQKLSQQYAAGGGDYPEAVHTALEESLNLSWSEDNRKKLAFIVLDAPPHAGSSYATSIGQSLNFYRTQGIQLFPVASSGIDKTTEFFLRNSAILTGGSYIFLTDHSGIGDSHLEPTAPDYTVEYLNDLLVRVIQEQLTGQAIDPVDYRQRH